MKMKRLSFARLALAVLLPLVALVACGAPPPPQVALRIGVFSAQDFLPYFVMQEQGFAKQHGLRFEETPYTGGGAALDAMMAGSLDVCPSVGSVPLLTAAQRGLIPGTLVAVAANNFAGPDHLGVGVLVARSVNGWKDLRGKHIAVNALGSMTTAAVRGRLRQEGVDDYRLVEIPFENMGLAVAVGNVAGAGMNEPFLTQSLLRGDGKVLGWVIGGLPFERIQLTTIVFRGEFLQKSPQGVKAFLRAHLQAVKWMNENEKEARSILARRLNLSQEVGQKMKLLRWPLDARNDPALLEGMQRLLVELGIFKTPMAARQLYDETLLDEVLKERRER